MFSFDDEFFDKLLLDAERSARKRTHYNIHKDYNEKVQRLCIALKRGTYVRPHYHSDADAWQMIMALRGCVAILIFDIDGSVIKRIELSSDTGIIAIEMEPNTWHMAFPVSSEAILFEVKEGPFSPKKNSDFACWSPEENSDEVDEFLVWAQCAKVDDQYRK